jgi:HD-GYP domain-containing protein (c-di-GMP phosphodiesterase class II)
MPFVPLDPHALRIGLYIKIEGSWFSHPFPTNSFKISSVKDLVTLQGLPDAQLLVDFDRSDPDPALPTKTSGPSVLEPDESLAVGESVSGSESEGLPSFEHTAVAEDARLRQMAQQEAFREYQAHLQEVKHQFQEVLEEAKQTVHDVVSGRPRGLRTAQKIVDNLIDLVEGSDNSRALLNLIGSNEPNDELFLHATNVCSLSLMVGMDLGFKREEIEKLALGAFLHDVGELKYPTETLLRKGAMGKGELKTFQETHPKFGVEMVEKIPNFPYEAVEVIRQHHERLDGSGQPSGKRDLQISKLAKIVMAVDLYDELCHHSDPARSLMPSEALSYLYVKCRKTLWNDAVVSLIKQLGVYPPGSLVHLSNQTIGIVTSVNGENRLRPIILVYDEQTSQDEPFVLNLAEEEESLIIVQAIRPADIAPKFRECLNPRRFISYFPSTTPIETSVAG